MSGGPTDARVSGLLEEAARRADAGRVCVRVVLHPGEVAVLSPPPPLYVRAPAAAPSCSPPVVLVTHRLAASPPRGLGLQLTRACPSRSCRCRAAATSQPSWRRRTGILRPTEAVLLEVVVSERVTRRPRRGRRQRQLLRRATRREAQSHQHWAVLAPPVAAKPPARCGSRPLRAIR